MYAYVCATLPCVPQRCTDPPLWCCLLLLLVVARAQTEVPKFDEADLPALTERYKGMDPIFHKRNEAGKMVTYSQ